MSDFLVNLARRSAGLAPVVRARSAPFTDAGDGDAREVELQISRGAAEGAEPRAGVTSEPRMLGVPSAAHVVAPVPIAVTRTPMIVAQRAPLAHAAPPAPAAPSAPIPARGEAPLLAPRAAPQPGADVTTTIERRLETIVQSETADAQPPAVVTIEPVERAATATPVTRAESAPERTVHVRIGAIEIYGADASQQQPVAATPAPAAAVAAPTSPAAGFDDYAALRSYAPWAW